MFVEVIVDGHLDVVEAIKTEMAKAAAAKEGVAIGMKNSDRVQVRLVYANLVEHATTIDFP